MSFSSPLNLHRPEERLGIGAAVGTAAAKTRVDAHGVRLSAALKRAGAAALGQGHNAGGGRVVCLPLPHSAVAVVRRPPAICCPEGADPREVAKCRTESPAPEIWRCPVLSNIWSPPASICLSPRSPRRILPASTPFGFALLFLRVQTSGCCSRSLLAPSLGVALEFASSSRPLGFLPDVFARAWTWASSAPVDDVAVGSRRGGGRRCSSGSSLGTTCGPGSPSSAARRGSCS